MIKFNCSQCGRAISVSDSAAGRKGKCGCGAILDVPASSPPAPAPEILDAEVWPDPPPADPQPSAFPIEPALLDIVEEPAPAQHEEPRRPCPMCGEMIAVNAIKCRFCGEIFDPALKKAQAKKTAGSDDDMTTGEWVIAILCSGIGCIVGIVWLIQGKRKGGKMLGISLLFAVLWNIVVAFLKQMGR
jgi:predicted RNA-binding Zn-ribbon protein involved in translation (DUF1610 family)